MRNALNQERIPSHVFQIFPTETILAIPVEQKAIVGLTSGSVR